jgi:hypothetical protein
VANAYPQFRSSYSHKEMVEHFLLTTAELQLVLTCRGDANRCGMALLLKMLSHLGPGMTADDDFVRISSESFSLVVRSARKRGCGDYSCDTDKGVAKANFAPCVLLKRSAVVLNLRSLS